MNISTSNRHLELLEWVTHCAHISGPIGTKAYIISDAVMTEAKTLLPLATLQADKQRTTVRCALADLCGAYQADDFHMHDWKAHLLTISELAEAFGLEDEVPKDCWSQDENL